jgi:hypothetical protein
LAALAWASYASLSSRTLLDWGYNEVLGTGIRKESQEGTVNWMKVWW